MRKFKDLTGKRFGRLIVEGLAGRDKHGRILWNTICDCGNKKIVPRDQLLKGETKSCGCLRKEMNKERCTKPMVGKVFGRLTVLFLDHNKKGHNYYRCQCSCGNITVVDGTMLRSGNTRSCGCYNKDRAHETSFKDLTGMRFGKLVVTGLAPQSESGDTQFHCVCDCGGELDVLSYSLTGGTTMSCGCLKSKGEFIIAKILTDNNIPFVKQKSFNDLRSEKGGVLKFDFYVIDKGYLIEYDGEQHYAYSESGWNTKEHFEEAKCRDELKDKYCTRHNIPLIRIPYTIVNEICIEDLLLETSQYILKV